MKNSLPDSHSKSDEGADDVDGSSAKFQGERYKEYTPDSQARTVGRERVVQFGVANPKL